VASKLLINQVEAFSFSGWMMKHLVGMLTIAAAAVLVASPACAAVINQVPEPVSMSLLAGGIVAIAAVRHLRRK
jgi:uncharacterized membrane protein HdeD (DUF308 family)